MSVPATSSYRFGSLLAVALLIIVALGTTTAWAGQGGGPPGSALKVGNVVTALEDGTLTISGEVMNIGTTQIRHITVKVITRDGNDEETGKKTTPVNMDLWPGGVHSFSCTMAMATMPEAVQLYINGPVEKVIFEN